METPSYYAVIPANVRYAEIPPNAKLLYGEITALTSKEGYCWASNDYFAKLYGVDKGTISSWVSSLKEHGFVDVSIEKNYLRKITLSGKAEGGIHEKLKPPTRKAEESITSNTTKKMGGDFAPLPPEVVREICKEEEDPIGNFEKRNARIIPKPYSPHTTREAWKNGERRLQILEWFFTEKGIWAKADTEVKLKAFMKRHSDSAKRLAHAEWKKSELREAQEKACFSPQMEEEWTLETIEKYLTK